MDGTIFDALTRRLAGSTSRRLVVRGMLGGVAAAAGVRELAVAAPAARVEVCHRTGNGSYQPITVSGNAVNAHLGHGDQICSNPENGTSVCTPGGCEVTCADGYHACDSGCCVDDPQCWYQWPDGSAWVPAGTDYGHCRDLDSCFGGGGESQGGCYKWTVNPDDDFSGWLP